MEAPRLGGRYELGLALGSGGFGTVYRARDGRTGLEVAVKLVPPGEGRDAARLLREGELLRTVRSRRVLRVLDLGEDAAGAWLVTELVEGGPLVPATFGRALFPHEVLQVARALLEALADVHAAGLVHGDVKPANVLVPAGALDGLRLVDFGLARGVGDRDAAAGAGEHVLGTPAFLAPEVLAGATPTPAADLYGAGLVLFGLLDAGPLFPDTDVRTRLVLDPVLTGRVPEPLAEVLGRLLAREPLARWRDGIAAHEAVVDLATAPVSVIASGSVPPSVRSAPPSMRSLPPVVVASAPPARPASTIPPSLAPASEARRRELAPRLAALPADPLAALRATLLHLDLPMLDALARRERGGPLGRVARGLALALRLELDAAALLLEPLAAQSDVARAIGVTVLAPRARRATRARVDPERADPWLDTVEPTLAAGLVALGAVLAPPGDAPRDDARAARLLARAELTGDVRDTLAIARIVPRVRLGALDRASALAGLRGGAGLPALHGLVRALAAAALAVEPGDLDPTLTADTGATLLDAALAAAVARTMAPDERGLFALERAATLLAQGDAPGLEHEIAHRRGAALVRAGRPGEGQASFRAARVVAHAERIEDAEVHSAALEVLAAFASEAVALDAAAVLADARLASTSAPVAVAGLAARVLLAVAAGDDGRRLLGAAEARLADAAEDPEATALVVLARQVVEGDPGAAARLETADAMLFWLAALDGAFPGRGLADLAERALTRSRRTDFPPAVPAP